MFHAVRLHQHVWHGNDHDQSGTANDCGCVPTKCYKRLLLQYAHVLCNDVRRYRRMQLGDVVTWTATGVGQTASATLPSAGTTWYTGAVFWNGLGYEPQLMVFQITSPSGLAGNQWGSPFFGSGSQSTVVSSAKTGTIAQVEQHDGHVHLLKSDGTITTLFQQEAEESSTVIAFDDVSGDLVAVITAHGTAQVGVPTIMVVDESGKNLCFTQPSGITFISGIAAKGGYVTFTAPLENLIGIASLTGCTGGLSPITFQTIKVSGQPWSVAMAINGSELDAYVLSRDKALNGVPMLTKVNVATAAIEGSGLALTNLTPVSVVRATNPNAGLYQVVAFSSTPIAAVL